MLLEGSSAERDNLFDPERARDAGMGSGNERRGVTSLRKIEIEVKQAG